MADLHRTAPWPKPKGPLPLFLHDLERDTIGWPDGLRWCYLRVLDHLWAHGGMMPDSDDEILAVAGIKKGRGYAGKLELIRAKLVLIDVQIAEWEDEKAIALAGVIHREYGLLCRLYRDSFPNGQAKENPMVTQKRLLRDIAKVLDLSQKRSIAGKKGGRPRTSNSFDGPKANEKPPTPTLVSKKERGGKTPPNRPHFAFTGNVIRLTAADLERWRKAYKNIPNIEAELTSCDDYLAEEGVANSDKWFHRASAWLRRSDADYVAKGGGGHVSGNPQAKDLDYGPGS